MIKFKISDKHGNWLYKDSYKGPLYTNDQLINIFAKIFKKEYKYEYTENYCTVSFDVNGNKVSRLYNLKKKRLVPLIKPCSYHKPKGKKNRPYLQGSGIIKEVYVGCPHCQATGPVCDDEEKAIKRWNK